MASLWPRCCCSDTIPCCHAATLCADEDPAQAPDVCVRAEDLPGAKDYFQYLGYCYEIDPATSCLANATHDRISSGWTSLASCAACVGAACDPADCTYAAPDQVTISLSGVTPCGPGDVACDDDPTGACMNVCCSSNINTSITMDADCNTMVHQYTGYLCVDVDTFPPGGCSIDCPGVCPNCPDTDNIQWHFQQADASGGPNNAWKLTVSAGVRVVFIATYSYGHADNCFLDFSVANDNSGGGAVCNCIAGSTQWACKGGTATVSWIWN